MQIIEYPTAAPTNADYFLMQSVEDGTRAVSAQALANGLLSMGGNQDSTFSPDFVLSNEAAGTPVGEIISYMGITAPPNYLICDGTAYDIDEYPYLAQHFIDDFGSVNFFGGDGETTFAVPDLRGEFLRGSGTNSHTQTGTNGKTIYEGNGSNPGVHQIATLFPNVIANYNDTYKFDSVIGEVGIENVPKNWDSKLLNNNQPKRSNINDGLTINTTISPIAGTIRPTNTSVLYCIKYKPTYFATVGHVYSFEERRVGTWVDGKPLYEKTVDFGSLPNASEDVVSHGIENVDTIWINDGYTVLPNKNVQGLSYFKYNNLNAGWFFAVNKTAITCGTGTDRSDCKATVILRYTKTTDDGVTAAPETEGGLQ